MCGNNNNNNNNNNNAVVFEIAVNQHNFMVDLLLSRRDVIFRLLIAIHTNRKEH